MRATPRPTPARALLLAAGLAALLALPSAAAVKLGTPGGEILTGTNKADKITGDGGDDTLRGLAGNDTYYFADGWGEDLLEEKASYTVNGKKLPGGTDTLSFKGVKDGRVQVTLLPEWRGQFPLANEATGPNGELLRLGKSVVERVVGTVDEVSGDEIVGGSGANRLATGGGTSDIVQDIGGWNDGPKGFPNLAPSNDLFVGAAANTGLVLIADFGGTADVLDLRPLRSDEVYLAKVDCDDADPALECLQIVTGNGDGEVQIVGQFGEFNDFTAAFGQQGRVETILFADGPVSFVPQAARGAGGRDGEALLGRAETPRQRRLAERASTMAGDALTADGPLNVVLARAR